MATIIKLKQSNVRDRRPTASELALGELAVNTFDGKLFARVTNPRSNDEVIEIERSSQQGGVIYVSSTGDDENDGLTIPRAKSSIKAAMDVARENVLTPKNNPGLGFVNARKLLQKNRRFIQEETIAYINKTYPDFEYNEEKCFRDVGLIVDSVAHDIYFGGNEECHFAANSYYEYGKAVIQGQEVETADAIDFARDTALKIIANELIDDIEQLTLFERIQNPYPTGVASGKRNAFDHISKNRSFLAAEVIAYVNLTFPDFEYNQETCRRDTEYLIDAIRYDVLYGGNQGTIDAALSYYTNSTSQIPNQESETASAINYLKDIIIPVALGTPISIINSENKTQDLTSGPGGASSASRAGFLANIVVSIVTNGPSAVPISESQDFSWVTQELVSDRTDLRNAKADIIQSTTNYIDTNFINFEFDRAKCERDVGLIIDAISDDIALNSNYRSVIAGLSYRRAVASVVRDNQLPQTVDSIRHAKTQALQIVKSDLAKQRLEEVWENMIDILENDLITPQTIDSTLINGSDAKYRVTELFDMISMVLTDPEGVEILPELEEGVIVLTPQSIRVASGIYFEDNPVSIPPFTSMVGDSLRTTIIKPKISNRDMFFVTTGCYVSDVSFEDHLAPSAAIAFDPQGNIILTSSPADWKSPYIQNCTSKTTTGTGMRIDGDASGGLRSMVCDSFTQYNQGGVGIHLLNRGYAQLVSVFTICCKDGFLAESGGFCSVTNSNSSFGDNGLRATGVSETLYTGRFETQSLVRSDTFEIVGLSTRPNVGDAIKFSSSDVFYTVVESSSLFETINPVDTTDVTTLMTDAISLMALNKEYIKSEVIGYINDIYFVYDKVKCQRDTQLIIDAAIYDSALGTNYNSVTTGLAYRRSSADIVIQEQSSETVSAILFAKQQAATSLAESQLAISRSNMAFDEIVDIIVNGEDDADQITFPAPSNATLSKIEARDQLLNNKEFLKAEVIAYIKSTYPFLIFNEDKCSRDVGFIIDALIYDILYSGNSATVSAAKSYFSNAVSQVPGQRLETADAIVHLSNIINEVVRKREIIPTTGNLLSQNTSAGTASLADANNLSNLALIVSNVIKDGEDVIPEIVYPDISWVDEDMEKAVTQLKKDRAVISRRTINYINNQLNGFSYNEDKCARDVGLILDAMLKDMAQGGVEFTDRAARSYKIGNSSVVSGQIDQTIQGIERIGVLLEYVLNQTVGPTLGRVSQITDNSKTAEETALPFVQGLIQDIVDTINDKPNRRSTVILEQIVDEVISGSPEEPIEVTFHQHSLISTSSHTFEFIGTGTDINFALPYLGGVPIEEQEVVEDENGAGRVYYTSTDQTGDFNIGPELTINRASGTISGRTFNKSLFAVLTPYILAIEG